MKWELEMGEWLGQERKNAWSVEGHSLYVFKAFATIWFIDAVRPSYLNPARHSRASKTRPRIHRSNLRKCKLVSSPLRLRSALHNVDGKIQQSYRSARSFRLKADLVPFHDKYQRFAVDLWAFLSWTLSLAVRFCEPLVANTRCKEKKIVRK